MRRRPSTSRSALALALALIAFAWSGRARAQACCAGSAALTPGRLAMHEDALVGVQARAANAIGSYDASAHYAASPPGTSEQDLEEDVFAAVRVVDRGQVALLVPAVETRRTTRANGAEIGGGLGDVNASARYDFHLAGQSEWLPGIAALAGVTFPTGTAPESASKPLATDATGVGALQGNLGLALEQTYGPWLLDATFIVAKRAPRTVLGVDETLGTQLTFLAAAAYTFDDDSALALVASYTLEGDASIDGRDAAGTARSLAQIATAGVLPLADTLRLQGSVFLNPPLSSLGRNLPASTGLTLALIRSWS